MQSLGRRTVVLLPQGKDGVGIRVEFPETCDQAGQQVAVSDDVLHPRTRYFLLVQQGDTAVAFRGIEGKHVARTAVFAVFTEHVAEPPLIARAAAPSVVLHPFAESSALTVVLFIVVGRNIEPFFQILVVDTAGLALICMVFH